MHQLGLYLNQYFTKIRYILEIAQEKRIFTDPVFLDKLLVNSKKYYDRCIQWVKAMTTPEDAFFF